MLKNIFMYSAAVCLFAFPSLVSAVESNTILVNSSSYSEEELVTLIAKLQKQLEEVRKNKTQCILADIDLSIGDGEGDGLKNHVKNLQAFLKEKGYLKVEPTGYFGKLTRAALIGYQKNAGLSQTGELNSGVRTAIKNLKCQREYMVKKTEVKKEIKEVVNNTGMVTSISLVTSGNMVKWSTAGYSKNGFKVVYSKNPNPTYPTRDGDKYIYLAEPGAYKTTLEAFNGSGTYYVRACEYLGGSCGVYSNEVSVSL